MHGFIGDPVCASTDGDFSPKALYIADIIKAPVHFLQHAAKGMHRRYSEAFSFHNVYREWIERCFKRVATLRAALVVGQLKTDVTKAIMRRECNSRRWWNRILHLKLSQLCEFAR